MGTAVDLNTEIFDLTLALQNVGGDGEFLAEIAGLIKAAWPTLLADLKEGMAAREISARSKKGRVSPKPRHVTSPPEGPTIALWSSKR